MRLLMLADAGSAHTVRWVRALAGRGHSIRLFTLTPPTEAAYSDLPGVSVAWQGIDVDLATRNEATLGKLRYLSAVPRVRREIRRWRPDVVHAHYASSYGLLATLAAARPRIVSVWGMDVYSFPSRSVFHRRVMASILGSADVVMATSHTMKRRVHELVERPVEVTPFGVDTSVFCPNAVTAAEAPVCIGTVKTLEAKYGIEYLVRAFAIAQSRFELGDAARLVVVGGGSLRADLESLAEALGIGKSVQFAGQKPYREIHSWHQKLDVAVYPSVDDSESFGVAAVESQACGVPVVVARVGGLPEVVREGETGFVVAPRDPEELATAIGRLALDPELRLRMGRAARQHVLRTYDLVECVRVMEEAYFRAAPSGLSRS